MHEGPLRAGEVKTEDDGAARSRPSPRGERTGLWRIGGPAIASFIGLVARSSKVVHEPADLDAKLRRNSPAILACWHGQFMMLATARPKDLRFAAMVARHGDAEPIAQAMAALGVELIRGAGAGGRKKDRGGAQALRASIAALDGGASIVMTADVPPGPARVAGLGIVTLARLSGRPILPVASATSRYRSLPTWSRLTINLPFSRLAHVVGDPITVPRDADAQALEAKRKEVESALTAVWLRAYELAGADPAAATPGAVLPPPANTGLRLSAYRALTTFARPALPFVLRWRAGKGKEDPARQGERFGRSRTPRPDGPLIWMHAASVGEMNAILPVIDGLGRARPDVTCLITTGTVTSAEVARQRLTPGAIHQFVPLDVPAHVRRFLAHWRPDLAVLTESEVWPNLVLETTARGIPLALVNARMSRRSHKRWRRQGRLARRLFSRFDLVLAQTPEIAAAFTDLGAPVVGVAGNLKIDAPAQPVDHDAYERLVAAASGRQGYVAASTHEGEEAIVGAAHKILARRFESFLTIIAPRHPERGTAVAEALRQQGLRVRQRSLGDLPEPATEVYVADTIGELGTLFALAPIALIGGSLIDRGGQNPIEAVRHQAAVLTGPSWRNFPDVYGALIEGKGARVVTDAASLAGAVGDLIADESALRAQHAAAVTALAGLGGALERTVSALLERLPVRAGRAAPDAEVQP
ncbi:MAG: glycosyltransferase N-terminal domain-containing protein [Hyphomicrobiaceae bacterium]|nr:glycosyltransferase N-terminal domain-containing protein [Hyphomicrobiaceae bacterium]